jgi:deoxyadenosine/deoxycytidine kinase
MRGREFEKDIDPSYVEQLNDLYEDWIAHFKLSPVLIVPSDDLDFVANSRHLDLIIEKIREKLGGKDEVFFRAEDIARANTFAA